MGNERNMSESENFDKKHKKAPPVAQCAAGGKESVLVKFLFKPVEFHFSPCQVSFQACQDSLQACRVSLQACRVSLQACRVSFQALYSDFLNLILRRENT